MPRLINYKHLKPQVAADAFIAAGACLVGDVRVGDLANIWFNCVIRGDVEPVTIGARTNVQDGTVIHVTRNGFPTVIGTEVTIGHQALLHACTIGDRVMVGMGAVVLDGAIIEDEAMLGAGAVLTPGKRIKTGELWLGNPAKFFRELSAAERAHFKVSAENYVIHGREYRAQLPQA